MECNTKKKFCVLQKKDLSFGPNRTVEVQPNSSAERSVGHQCMGFLVRFLGKEAEPVPTKDLVLICAPHIFRLSDTPAVCCGRGVLYQKI